MCNEVPDDYTVTSNIQKYLNTKYNNKYRVLNVGSSSVVAVQELERLKTLQLKENDIVIFYDGANDILQSVYYQNPKGWIIGTNHDLKMKMSEFQKAMLYLYTLMENKSYFVRLFFQPFDNATIPEHLTDNKKIQKLNSEMAENYMKTITEAHDYTIKSNAKFYHFYQPNMFERKNTSYESALKKNNYLVTKGLDEIFQTSSPIMKNVTKKLTERGIQSFDLSDIFNAKELVNKEIFIDWVHVTHLGNAIIADEIIKRSLE